MLYFCDLFLMRVDRGTGSQLEINKLTSDRVSIVKSSQNK